MPTIVRCPTCKPNVSWNPLIKKWRKQDYLSDKSFFGHSVLRFYPQLIQPPYYPCRTVTPSSCHLCLSVQFSWVRLFFFFFFSPTSSGCLPPPLLLLMKLGSHLLLQKKHRPAVTFHVSTQTKQSFVLSSQFTTDYSMFWHDSYIDYSH